MGSPRANCIDVNTGSFGLNSTTLSIALSTKYCTTLPTIEIIVPLSHNALDIELSSYSTLFHSQWAILVSHSSLGSSHRAIPLSHSTLASGPSCYSILFYSHWAISQSINVLYHWAISVSRSALAVSHPAIPHNSPNSYRLMSLKPA